MPPPVGSDAPPIGGSAPSAAVDHAHVMRHGRVYHVYLAGYSRDGLQRAWDTLFRHARHHDAGGESIVSPRLLSHTPQGDVYEAQAMVRTWRDPGREYTWGDLHSWMNRHFREAGDVGSLAAWCALQDASGLDDAIDAAESLGGGIGSTVHTTVDTTGAVLGEIPAAGEAIQGAAAGAGNALTGLGQAGQALGAVHPLLAFAAVVAIAAGAYWLSGGSR